MTICDHHDLPLVNGYHELVDPEGIEGVAKIPCAEVAAIGTAVHEVFCHRNAPMHSDPFHSGMRLYDLGLRKEVGV